MDDLPKRTDPIYQEIKDFEPYEITSCIAYEMGTRNKDVKNIFDILECLEECRIKLLKSPIQDECSNLHAPKLCEEYSTLGLYDLNILIEENETELKETYHLYPRDAKTTKYGNYLLVKKIVSDTNDQNYTYSSNQIQKEGFFVEQGLNTAHRIYDLSHINTFFKRQIYEINQTNVALNFALSKSELIAYISQIKDTYDDDMSIIKSPLELLGEKLELDTIEIKDMTANEWADCFFIYDYFIASLDKTKNTKYEKIQELLTEYHGVKVEKTESEIKESKKNGDNSTYKIVSYNAYQQLKDTIYTEKKIKNFYSTKTIIERYKLMTALIDDLQYTTMITK